ncbi:MAG: rhomboid family intramembrane serine protease [Candidatus Aquicultorales bacterium]
MFLIPIRDERRMKKTPYVTYTIIALNVLVFLYQMTMSPSELNAFFARYALFPAAITNEFFGDVSFNNPLMIQPAFLTVFTSMFMHGGLLHIVGNMLYFWVFGNNIEDTIGPYKFGFLYLGAGVAAALAHVASAPSAVIPTIGASGAIAGILASYLIIYPHVRIISVVPVFFFVTLIRVPAILFVGLWAVLQALQGTASLGTNSAGQAGVAWFAHIGGFAAGAVLTLALMPRHKREAARKA